MRFKLENLGCLKDVDIELGDLTIICGKNNTGKTYINYAIYG
ncbi:AAA family ATPase, partial [Planktothrix sp.]